MKTIPTLQGDRQLFENYTGEDHQVWKLLFERQEEQLERYASHVYLDGLVRIGFHANAIPSFDRVNAILSEATGWELVAVPGIVDDRKFFELMSQKRFPATTWLRRMEEIDYLEEPDMFHDVFAHVPLLADQHFADFLHALSQISLRYINNPLAIELLSRVYWYTVEFGLIRENGQLRIYGAGILSSVGETRHSMGLKPMRFEFNPEQLLNSPYRKDVFQDRYFIIDSFEQLYASIDDIGTMLEEQLKKSTMFA